MDVSQITALIGAAASLLCTVVVGALTFFMQKEKKIAAGLQLHSDQGSQYT